MTPPSTSTELEALVFDIDGTMYDQGRLRRRMAARLLTAYALSPVSGWSTARILRAYRHAQEYLRDRNVDGSLAAAQLQVAVRLTGVAPHAVAACVDRWILREPLPFLRACRRDGLSELLAWARSAGLRLGVVSDYPATAKLEALDVAHWFDVVVTAQDEAVQRFKPDPAGLRHALERMNVAPANAVYLGDREDVDAVMAERAGVRCLIIGSPRPATSRTVANFHEVPIRLSKTHEVEG